MWVAVAFWLAVLAGAIAAVTKGLKWLYVTVVIAASCISAWTVLQIARLHFSRSLVQGIDLFNRGMEVRHTLSFQKARQGLSTLSVHEIGTDRA
jgi:hypothetical protein